MCKQDSGVTSGNTGNPERFVLYIEINEKSQSSNLVVSFYVFRFFCALI